jgi:hypothetical protein
MNRAELERAVGRSASSREGFLASLRDALDRRQGCATGKLGLSERAFLEYPMVLETISDPLRIRAYARLLSHRMLRYVGISPTDPEFAQAWAAHYARAVRQLDVLGIYGPDLRATAAVPRHHRLSMPLVNDQVFDRSSPSDPERCWLPLLRGRRVVLLCPFAELLRCRADCATFEAVWAKRGRRWFYPASVHAVELPSGIDPATWRRYDTCLELVDEVCRRIDAVDFDVALIAPGGIGIPLAAHVKRTGRMGISLGGPLQVLFGVHGERWLADARWPELYFTDAWMRLPAEIAPGPEVRKWATATVEG